MLNKIIGSSNKEAKCFYRRMLLVTEGATFLGERVVSPTEASTIAELLAKCMQLRMGSMGGELQAINYTLREWRGRTNVSDKVFRAVIHHLQIYWNYGKYVKCRLTD